jgi:histidine phosphotransferase ChpT
MTLVNLDSLDLAALVCSRVCHDVISPVGAIVNGLEVLAEEKDAGMRDFALDLIGKSARTASARLQFARIAFGAAGSAGSAIDTGDAEQVAKGCLNDEKIRLTWTGPRLLMPKNRVKLLLNLLVVAASCIPRGGSVDCVIEGDADHPIQPFYAGMVARASDMEISLSAHDEFVKILAARMSARIGAAA